MSGATLTKGERDFFSSTRPYGFILFTRNIESPAQVRMLIAELKNVTGRERLPILIDQEGGRVARLKPPHWPKYPPASVFASLAQRDLEAAKRAVFLNARLIAHDLAQLGITVDCAPVADVPVKGAHDVIGDRAFGHTPQQVIVLARAQADGLMAGGIVPVLKHIPGHGRALADSHEELPVVREPLEALRTSDFVPFKALADLPMAMTAHVLYTAIDKDHMATVSPAAIGLIRQELQFDGLLMSDDISMKAMQGDFTKRARNVLAAGCDVVLHCNGKMDEMQAVAKGVGALAGVAQERAQSAMSCVSMPKPFDVAMAKKEIENLFSQVA